MKQTIHIVCLDAPSPPDYGGAIDMFYKIRALGQIGHRIVLHYFNYRTGRGAKGLEEFCAEVHAYKRKGFFQSLPLSSPFIVQSRINAELVQRLNDDGHPILLEGLHCAGLIPFIHEKKRVVLRMHNEESSYYRHLADSEKSLLRKAYYKQESRLLEKYQSSMDKSIPIACLAETDMAVFEKHFGFRHSFFLPCFLPWQLLNCKKGKGTFCLYHGNLTVSENDHAALWLIENVFSTLTIPFVIAGRGASKNLQQKAAGFSHIRIVNNPSIAEIETLVKEAHVNVLPSLNNTGVKLKLLNAALNGRFCITNSKGIAGSRISGGVLVCDSAAEWINLLPSLMQTSFSEADKEERQSILDLYNNRKNAEELSARWMHCQ